MHRTFSADAMTLPSEREQRARIRFALALDPTCCDAYLAEGDLEERKGHTRDERRRPTSEQ
jgi:hypothetical protein